MGAFGAISLLGLFSFVFASPSVEDYGLCYIVNQYCTSQSSPASTGLSHHPVSKPRIGKSGPRGRRGPPGTVNYAAIDEKIVEKYLGLEAKMNQTFTRWMETSREMEKRIDLKISRLQNASNEAVEETNERVSMLMPSSCEHAKTVWRRSSGLVDIYRNGRRYQVYCDMQTDGGGWTVFQRRMDGSVDFFRDWESYAQGFGFKSGEFWLGLETIYQLTRGGAYELRVDLTDWDGSTAYAKYNTFSIGAKSAGYKLTVGGYSGTAGDSMEYHNGIPFSAKDKDLDTSPLTNCAAHYAAAWWFRNCAQASLNGRYNDTSDYGSGVYWYHWGRRNPYSLRASEMKLRKK